MAIIHYWICTSQQLKQKLLIRTWNGFLTVILPSCSTKARVTTNFFKLSIKKKKVRCVMELNYQNSYYNNLHW